MGLRGWVKKLEREALGELIEIPQQGGTVKRFPQSAAREAFINLMDRHGAGEDAPPEHPMIDAVRNSSEPERWAATPYLCEDPQAWTEPVEDLSEGA